MDSSDRLEIASRAARGFDPLRADLDHLRAQMPAIGILASALIMLLRNQNMLEENGEAEMWRMAQNARFFLPPPAQPAFLHAIRTLEQASAPAAAEMELVH